MRPVPAGEEEERLALVVTVRDAFGMKAAEEMAQKSGLPHDQWALVKAGIKCEPGWEADEDDPPYIWTMPQVQGGAH